MELFTKRRVKLRAVPTQRGLEETELKKKIKKIWKKSLQREKLNLILKPETAKQLI